MFHTVVRWLQWQVVRHYTTGYKSILDPCFTDIEVTDTLIWNVTCTIKYIEIYMY